MGQQRIHPVVLCGGSGTRLWPLSRALYPKQLLALASERTLLQDTILRVTDSGRFTLPVVVGNEEHRFILLEQLRELGVEADALIVEPVGRNTAPAAAVAALLLTRAHSDAHMLVMPADHVIADPDAFRAAIAAALRASESGRLVTVGITPTGAHAGYGYIQRGSVLDGLPRCHGVARFVEKPAPRTAQELLRARALWNSFIFGAQGAMLLGLLRRHLGASVEDMATALARDAQGAGGHALAEFYQRLPTADFSRDVAQRATHLLRVIRAPACGWSDLGTPRRLAEILRRFTAPRKCGTGSTSEVYFLANPGVVNLAAQHARLALAG